MIGETRLRNHSRPVAIWLMVGVGMLIVQILLGGVTRLSGSGLSITEWNVITGAFPPLNEKAWLANFEKYRQTPQFRLLNFDFTLQDFKFIFFWEWFHRLWARLMVFVFFIPFVIFLFQKRFNKEMIKPLIVLFLLGALQGRVGWIMVASGLTGDAVYVQPAKLALHFIFAIGLLSYTYWFALQLLIDKRNRLSGGRPQGFIIFLILMMTLQLIYGALMAGNKAATAAPTWPDINGALIPAGMMSKSAGLLNVLENKITIHFIHRLLAYLILLLLAGWTLAQRNKGGNPLWQNAKRWPIVIVLVQVLLGILAVLSSAAIVPNHWGRFEWLAECHQFIGILLLLSLITLLFLAGGKSQARAV